MLLSSQISPPPEQLRAPGAFIAHVSNYALASTTNEIVRPQGKQPSFAGALMICAPYQVPKSLQSDSVLDLWELIAA